MVLRAVALFLLLTGCGERTLAQASGGLKLDPTRVDFPHAWAGHRQARTLTVRNEARGTRSAAFTIRAPFTVSPSTIDVPGGSSVTVEVVLLASEAGAYEGTLALEDSAIPVTAQALAPPECPAAEACHARGFDTDAGACVDSLLADGTACGGNACLESPTCQAGVCRGATASCDDANACTTDSCGVDGCIHAERSCPVPADPCQAALCDPATGCSAQQALDGTACGASDCQTAHVCIAGACVQRPVPDGATCGEATACTDAPTCQQGACIDGPVRPLIERWTYFPTPGWTLGSFGSQDPQGNFYLLESQGMSAQLVSLQRSGTQRFKVPVGEGNSVVRGPIDTTQQQLLLVSKSRILEARALSDGSLRWSVNLFDALKPLFDRGPQATYSFSLSELTLVSPNLLVLNVHEDASSWRSWVVAINLITGQPAWNREHPGHLSSFVADSNGGVFYLESQGFGGAYTVVALDSLGASKWTKALPPNTWASALSVVDNAVLLGGIDQWLDAKLGGALGNLNTQQAGFMSVGDSNTAWVAKSGCNGAGCSDSLMAFDAQTHQPMWSRPLVDGVRELFLGNRGMVIALTTPKQVYPVAQTTVVGIDRMGAELFRCRTPEPMNAQAVLDEGQLVGQTGTRVTALALPKMGPAPAGWISSRGSYLRTNRAR